MALPGYWIGNIQKRSGFGASSHSSGKAGIFVMKIRNGIFRDEIRTEILRGRMNEPKTRVFWEIQDVIWKGNLQPDLREKL
ncbi:hypothetical protein COP1_020245 [Malus domestica]